MVLRTILALILPAQEWPPPPIIEETQDIEMTDNTAQVNTNFSDNQETISLLNIINITKYSTLNKLLRITALVIQFVKTLKEKKKRKGTITEIDTKNAHNVIVSSVQQQQLYYNIKNFYKFLQFFTG